MTVNNIFNGKKVVQQIYMGQTPIYTSPGWQNLPSTPQLEDQRTVFTANMVDEQFYSGQWIIGNYIYAVGGSTGSSTYTTSQPLYLYKFDFSGNRLWKSNYDLVSGSTTPVSTNNQRNSVGIGNILTDINDNIYVIKGTIGGTAYEDSSGSEEYRHFSCFDKFDKNGNFILTSIGRINPSPYKTGWADVTGDSKSYDTNTSYEYLSFFIDRKENIYINIGYYGKIAKYDKNLNLINNYNTGYITYAVFDEDNNIYYGTGSNLTKYNENMQSMWASSLYIPNNFYGGAVLGTSNDIYILSNVNNDEDYRASLSRFTNDSSPKFIWEKDFFNTSDYKYSSDYPALVGVDHYDNLYVRYKDDLQKYSSDGTLLWSNNYLTDDDGYMKASIDSNDTLHLFRYSDGNQYLPIYMKDYISLVKDS